MALPATDDFNRAAPLGSNWTAGFIGTVPTIVSNELAGPSTGEYSAYWNADTPDADHYAQMEYSTNDASNDRGVCARMNGSDGVCWHAVFTGWTIRWYNGGSWTAIGSEYGTTPSANDIGKLEANGTTFTAYVNGTERATGSNGSAPSGGGGGVYIYQNVEKMDDFEVGNLGATTMGRMYSVSNTVAGVTAAIDLLRISAPTDAVVVVHKVIVTQETEFGDAASEQLDVMFHRGSTDGSGGATPTASPLEVGDSAFGGTCATGNTTQSTDGTILHREAFNVMAGMYWSPTPEERIVLSPSGRFIASVETAPDDSIDFRVTAYFEEIGG
jgi:hypothetical protein